MRRSTFVGLLFVLCCGFLSTQVSASSTMVPMSRQDCPGCPRWYELTENPNPDACLAARQNREYCHRWYHVGEEAPKPSVKAKKITIDQKIHFDFDKATIKKESYGILDDVASVLKSNPQIKKVRVEGHTDSIGSDTYNQKLSEKRANAVKDYLVGKGIEASRLEAVGYGESRPIADNKTAAGRAQNRRTEFNVVE